VAANGGFTAPNHLDEIADTRRRVLETSAQEDAEINYQPEELIELAVRPDETLVGDEHELGDFGVAAKAPKHAQKAVGALKLRQIVDLLDDIRERWHGNE